VSGESQQPPESQPDPSVLTTEAMLRMTRAERDYVNGQISVLAQRLDDMDEATKVLNETVNRTPTEIQKQVAHVRELLSAKLEIAESKIVAVDLLQQQRRDTVDKQFRHLDAVRSEDKRESRALVDLALSAQKEASAIALINANKAIDKAQESTEKRYDILDKSVQELRVMLASMMPRKESEARHSAHEQAVSALVSRVTAIEATKVGVQEHNIQNRGNSAAAVAAVSVGVAVLVMLMLLASFFIAKPS